jgi:hypothetical protein
MEEAWYKWFKFATRVFFVGVIIYAVTMAIITAPK